MAGDRKMTVRFLGDGTNLNQSVKGLVSGMDEAESAGKRVAAAMTELADSAEVGLKDAERASERLADALGVETVTAIEAAGRSVDGWVRDLKRMGLTIEEIEADADSLAAAIRRTETVAPSINTVGTSASTARGHVRDLGNEADNSRSVLANMVGNSAQDLGALSGVAGSAGVALGQLAEYAADGNIKLQSMIGIGAGLGGLAAGMWAIGKNAEQAAERAASLTQAIQDLSTVADEQVLDTFLTGLADSVLNGGEGPQAFIDQMAKENLPGLKRAYDLATQSGAVHAEGLQVMADAIYEAERAAAQGALTQERYGDASTSAAADVRDFADALAAMNGASAGAAAAVSGYVESLEEIPLAKRTEIVTAVAQGDYLRALALLDEVSKPRTVRIGIAVGAAKGAVAGNLGKGGIAGAVAAAAAAASSPSSVGSGGGGGGGGGGGSAAPEDPMAEFDQAIGNLFDTGQTSLDNYRQYLQGRLGAYETFSNEYKTIWSKLRELDRIETDAAKEAADAEKRKQEEAKKAAEEQTKLAEKQLAALQQLLDLLTGFASADAGNLAGPSGNIIGSGATGSLNAGQLGGLIADLLRFYQDGVA